MSLSWYSYFGFGTKSNTTDNLHQPATDKETSSPLCCNALTHHALLRVPTLWQHAPKYQNRLKDFLSWIDTTTSTTSEGDDWVEIASHTDVDNADFAFMILPDHVTEEQEEKERFYLPLSTSPSSTNFTQIGPSCDFLPFNHKTYLSTGNTVRLVCDDCREGFKITLLLKKGRSMDIQLIDIRDKVLRSKVQEMKGVFPGWRIDDLRWVLLKQRGDVRGAVEEVKNKDSGRRGRTRE